MKKIETYLPVFSGFYNTIFEANEESEIDYINEQRKENGLTDLDFDSIEFDYKQYELDVVESCINVLESELFDFVSKIELQKIISPKEYNFANDSVNVEITIRDKKISEYINDNLDEFNIYIKNRYTSYDGFISFYSNDYKDWINDTNNFTDFSNDGHKLGACLDFICKLEEINEETLYCGMEANIMANDIEHETTKDLCEDCGEYYSIKDIKDDYKLIVNAQIALIGEYGIKNPTIKPFEKWYKEINYKHCK